MKSFIVIIRKSNRLHYYHTFENVDDLVNMAKDASNQYNYNFNSVINNYHISIPMLSLFIKKLMKDKIYCTNKKQIIFDKNKLMYVSNLGLYCNYNKIIL